MGTRLGSQLMSVGELSERIGLITRTETIDDYGARLSEDSELTATVYAKVRYIDTREAESAAKQEKHTVEIKCWIRYDSTASQYKYVYWKSKLYDIYAIEETPGDRYTIIKARLIEV